jgi:hypothetical protein
VIVRPPLEEILRFDPNGHRYFVGNRELPSVTTVLGASFPFFAGESAMEAARRRGRIVHKISELDDRVELDESTVPDDLVPFLEGWRSFRRNSGFVPDVDGIEVQKHHSIFGYAGTIDRIGRDSRNRRILLDIKTGGRYPQYRLQLAAYLNLLSNPADYIRLCVVLDDSGRFGVEEYPRDFRDDFETFVSCLTLYNWKLRQNCLRRNG